MEAFRFIDRSYDVEKAAEAVAFLLQQCGGRAHLAIIQTVIRSADLLHAQRYGKPITTENWQGEFAGENLETLLYQFGIYSNVPAWRKLIERDLYHTKLVASDQPLEFSLLNPDERETLTQAWHHHYRGDNLAVIEIKLSELRQTAAEAGLGNVAIRVEAARLEAKRLLNRQHDGDSN